MSAPASGPYFRSLEEELQLAQEPEEERTVGIAVKPFTNMRSMTGWFSKCRPQHWADLRVRLWRPSRSGSLVWLAIICVSQKRISKLDHALDDICKTLGPNDELLLDQVSESLKQRRWGRGQRKNDVYWKEYAAVADQLKLDVLI